MKKFIYLNLLIIRKMLIVNIFLILIPYNFSFANENTYFKREFVMGIKNPPSALDPHSNRIAANDSFSRNLFDFLFIAKKNGGGFESKIFNKIKIIKKNTWHFSLNQKVFFYNGKKLSAKDVIYTIDRVKKISPDRIKNDLDNIFSYKAINDWTLEIKTKESDPNIFQRLSRIALLQHQDKLLSISKSFDENVFLGSGPYQFIKKLENGDILLKSNPYYHEGKPYLENVRLTYIPNDKRRVIALKKGKVDFIEDVPFNMINELESFNDVDITYSLSDMIYHLQLDTHRNISPYVKNRKGDNLGKNPLKSLYVRKAISHAINRDYIVNEALEGSGVSTNQIMKKGMVGNYNSIENDEWNIDHSKYLLKKSGYSKGFEITIHYTKGLGSNHNEEKIMKIIKDMLNQINIKVNLQFTNSKDFLDNFYSGGYSSLFVGISTYGDFTKLINILLHSYKKNSLQGSFNSGRYYNSKVDKLIALGNQEFDSIRRLEMQLSALEIALNDKAIIPLFFPKKIWGIRSDIGVEFWRNDKGLSLPYDVKKKRLLVD